MSPDSLQVVMEATSPEALKGLVAITRLSDEIANDAILHSMRIRIRECAAQKR